MAILFYDSIDLSSQEIQDVSLEKFTTALIPAGFQGRILYDTTLNVLKYFNGTGYVALDGTGNIDSVTTGNGLSYTGTADIIISPDYSSANNIINSALNQGTLGSASRILVANGNTVNYYPISDLETLIDSGVSSIITTGDSFITMTPGSIDEGAVTITAALTNTYIGAGKFLRGDGEWHTAPANTNTTYTLPLTYVSTTGGTGTITLTDGASTAISIVNFTVPSTADQIVITEPSAGTLQFGLASAIVTPGTLTTTGNATFQSDLSVTGNTTLTGTLDVTGLATFTAIPTIPSTGTTADTDAASKKYVDDVVAGGLIFQGGYDASVTPTAAMQAALQGWTYAVTTGGSGASYWNPILEEGDLIIAESPNPASQADWTILQNNVVLATNTTAGIAMFKTTKGFSGSMTAGQAQLSSGDAGTEGSATATPTVITDAFGKVTTLSSQAIAIPSSQISDWPTAVDVQLDKNTHVATIGDGSLEVLTVDYTIPAGLDVSVQLYQAASPYATVYARVERSVVTAGTTWRATITFATPPSLNSIKCLIVGSKA